MDDHWQYFNFNEIMREAKLRLAENIHSTAEAVTPEMKTLEYWITHCAHANAAACIEENKTNETARHH